MSLGAFCSGLDSICMILQRGKGVGGCWKVGALAMQGARAARLAMAVNAPAHSLSKDGAEPLIRGTRPRKGCLTVSCYITPPPHTPCPPALPSLPHAVHGVGVVEAPCKRGACSIAHQHSVAKGGGRPLDIIHGAPVHNRVAMAGEEVDLASLEHQAGRGSLAGHRRTDVQPGAATRSLGARKSPQ